MRLPYSCSGSSVVELVTAHREAPVEFPDPWPGDLPQRFRDILARLLEKSPDSRYQNYDDLLADLKKVRPAHLPKAGRVQRCLAWIVDLALANTLLQILSAPLLAIEWEQERSPAGRKKACILGGVGLY